MSSADPADANIWTDPIVPPGSPSDIIWTPAPGDPAPPAPAHEDPRIFAAPLYGSTYVAVLAELHRTLKPRGYLEIGMLHGETFALAQCASIGIDPELRLATSALQGKPRIHLFQTTSDRFFADHDPKALLGGPVEMAFLDGMHLFEFLLRDFANTEAHCRPNSVIALHDCVPTDVGMARRDPYAPAPGLTRNEGMWTGDVWKIVPLLRKYRPDLRIHVLDAPSTGLVLVTGLDPSSTVLRDRYAAIVEEASGMDLLALGIDAVRRSLDMRSTHDYAGEAKIAQHFWL